MCSQACKDKAAVVAGMMLFVALYMIGKYIG